MGVFQKDGMWWIDYYNKGRRYREKVGPNKRQAEKALGKRQVQIADDKFFDSRIRNKRFATFSKDVVEWYRVNSPKSVENISVKLKQFNEHFGNQTMDEITREDVEAYIEIRKDLLMKKRIKRGGDVDRSHFATINRDMAYLRKIFNLAIEKNYAKTNPCKGISKEKERERIRFLKDEENEEARILDACNPRIRRIALFSLHTGFRRGEILSLEWSSVDLDRGFVRVEATKAKNGTSRTLPINSVVREILTSLNGDRLKPQGYVFLNTLGKPYNGYTVYEQFAKAVSDAGVEDFRFHDLRHTFASRLAMRGVELLDLARLLGHKTIQMVMRYAHLTDDRLQSHVDLLTKPDIIGSRQQMDTIWTPEGFLATEKTSKYPRKSLN